MKVALQTSIVSETIFCLPCHLGVDKNTKVLYHFGTNCTSTEKCFYILSNAQDTNNNNICKGLISTALPKGHLGALKADSDL